MHNQQFLYHPNLVLFFKRVYSQNSNYHINSLKEKMNNEQETGHKLEAGKRRVLNTAFLKTAVVLFP